MVRVLSMVQIGACGALKAIISDFPLPAIRPYLDRIYTSEDSSPLPPPLSRLAQTC